MMKRSHVLVNLSIAIISFGFIHTNDQTKTELKKNIPLGKAKDIKTEIDFTIGTLNLSSSTKQLSEGIYRFYKNKWEPNISYEEDNMTGNLKIATIDERENKSYDEFDNCQWDLALNKNVKNDLTIRFNAGKGNIDLNGCELKRFDFLMTAGDVNINLSNSSVPVLLFKALAGNVTIDLSGKWDNDLNAILKTGFGEITLKLPSHTGVKLNVHGVLGEVQAPGLKKQNDTYTNALFGQTKESLNIDLTGGVGSVNIQLVN